eukprot:CAMPEP_0174988188 /NCGR_PEP_ID=MMETSP0004_2-20121128/19979_1 /TAXON_ID=420556 /ORGANISM="Ochromonas sp., Strain CCMP1393" /LENGTH=62 /DNA_ID=CAMNT_0016241361 /DNA_START=1186 /DNA_END=1374 /DNA_ORIENTATION=-
MRLPVQDTGSSSDVHLTCMIHPSVAAPPLRIPELKTHGVRLTLAYKHVGSGRQCAHSRRTDP